MEGSTPPDVMQNIKVYTEKAKRRLEDTMDIDDQSSSDVEARLSSTINDLQKRLEQRQAELNQVGVTCFA
jgi:flagellar capping protein FliD